jgi:hypothetical protein
VSVFQLFSFSRLGTIQLIAGVACSGQKGRHPGIAFNILISGLGVATLTLDEFHPCTTLMARSAEAFLCSSVMCAVILAMLSAMPLFLFEGHKTATCKDLSIAWPTPVLLDWAIVYFLLGLMPWYADKSDRWRELVSCGGVVCSLLAITTSIVVWMWQDMSRGGGLDAEEWPKVAATARAANHESTTRRTWTC